MSESRYIKWAEGMANERVNPQESGRWNAAFMVAMNWLLYKDGKRVLSAADIKIATDMYGPIK